MNKQYIQKIAQREKRELVSSYKKGTLYKLICDRAIEIRRNNDGSVSKIVFSTGGPNIYIEFYDSNVYVLVALDIYSSKSKIPSDCSKELLEMLND